MTKAIELTGQRFDRLTVTGRAKNDTRGRAQWRCVCACGREVVRQSRSLRLGRSRSCGCLKGRGAIDLSDKASRQREADRRRYHARKREREMVMNLATTKW
jgi:hypothetical protein